MNTSWADIIFDGQQDNLGGTRLVRCANIERFDELPGPTTGNLVELAPTFLDSGDAGWLTLLFTTDTATFSEKHDEGDGGPEWKCQVKGFIPCDSLAQRSQLEDMVRYRWIAEAQDNNDVWRRLGTLRNPARLTIDFTTDGNTTGGRGYAATFTWGNDRPAPIVELDPDLDGSYEVIPIGDITNPSGDPDV